MDTSRHGEGLSEGKEPAPNRFVANMEGAAAMPRSNGELIFEAPWQGRVFGMAIAMQDKGIYGWEEFRDQLIDEIAADSYPDPSIYYERWLASFESLLVQRGIVSGAVLETRTEEFESGEREDVF